MRRGLERYAPEAGYDPGPLARNRLALLVVRKAGIFPGDWALDVQTGEGLLGVNVARAFTRAKVVATDEDREALERAVANARKEGCDGRMRFVLCAPDALPFRDEFSHFTTIGLALAAAEEPLEILEEIHRATGFFGKIYVGAADLRKTRRKPRGIASWIFDDEAIAQMRAMGYGKVQLQQVAALPDGARIHLVTTKRFDPEEDDEDDEEFEEDEE